MKTQTMRYQYHSHFIFVIVAILAVLFFSFKAHAMTKDSVVKSTNNPLTELHQYTKKALNENTKALEMVAVQLKDFQKTVDRNLSDLGNKINISKDINSLNSTIGKLQVAVEDTSPGFFSSLFGWIFQVLAIIVGAGIAIFVMNKQIEASWSQFQKKQIQLQQSAEQDSQESWRQLLYSLGVKEKIENERFERDSEAKLRENENVQDALKIGLQIYVGVLSDYASLAVDRIESISEKPDEAPASLASIELPEPPPGLWENLHSYTNVTNDASSMAIVASHLYALGKHYDKLQRQSVIASFEGAKKVKEEEQKVTKSKRAIAELKEYKKSLAAYFNDIEAICKNALSEFDV